MIVEPLELQTLILMKEGLLLPNNQTDEMIDRRSKGKMFYMSGAWNITQTNSTIKLKDHVSNMHVPLALNKH